MHRAYLVLAVATALALVLAMQGETFAGGKGKSWTGGGPGWNDVPPGFSSPGKRKGWKGRDTPPGWQKGLRKGWKGDDVPPGWW
jgi:hypothetical protein